MTPEFSLICGDSRAELEQLPAGSVHTSMFSPPYWGLRDYGVEGQLGKEESLCEFIEETLKVIDGVKRVTHDSGTMWLNIGDCYAQRGKQATKTDLAENTARAEANKHHSSAFARSTGWQRAANTAQGSGLKPKQLVGVPWALAFAIRDRGGWYLRAECIWAKTNPNPSSITDRPTVSHEQVFLFSKKPRYFYDHEAIREPLIYEPKRKKRKQYNGKDGGTSTFYPSNQRGRNCWTVWPMAKANCPEDHFATYPEELCRRPILAGSSGGGCCSECLTPRKYDRYHGWESACACGAPLQPCTVLDPFAGVGTTGLVAARHGRSFIGIELNPDWHALAEERLQAAYSTLSRSELRQGQLGLFESVNGWKR